MMGLPTKKSFQRFERVRASGRFNMHDPNARILSGLDARTYHDVMAHYSELEFLYPDVRKKV